MPSRRPGGDRGQTLPDFAVGVSIFLITITFVFLFVPQVTLPYEEQEDPLVADRAASDLGNGLLTGSSPSELNETCTVAFFRQNDTAGCPIDTTEPLPAQLGVGSAYSVNVTLRTVPSDDPNSTVLCAPNGTIGDCGSGGDPLAVGEPTPGGDREVATARQGVYAEETGAVIEVRVW